MSDKRMKLESLLKGVIQMPSASKKQPAFLEQLDENALKTYHALKKLLSFSSRPPTRNVWRDQINSLRQSPIKRPNAFDFQGIWNK